jgi:hypothetical protein
VKRARHLAVPRHVDAEQAADVDVGRDRQQRVIAAMPDRDDRRPRGRGCRRVGQGSDDVVGVEAPVGVQPDRVDRRGRVVFP